MIQDTSLEQWYKIQSALGRSQKEVLDALRTQPNATNLEIAYMLKWPINRVTAAMYGIKGGGVGRGVREAEVQGFRQEFNCLEGCADAERLQREAAGAAERVEYQSIATFVTSKKIGN